MAKPDLSYLGHLRTDRRGLPVPYVNEWGMDADPSLISIRRDPLVGMPAVFIDDSAGQVPDFTRQNMQRQRECMIRGLCQVCARPVPWSRRFLPVAAMSVEKIELYGRQVAVTTEPWLDSWCAHIALNMCPDLIRRRRDEALTLVPIASRRDVEIVVSTGWVDGQLEAESRRVEPAMWVKLILKTTPLHLAGP